MVSEMFSCIGAVASLINKEENASLKQQIFFEKKFCGARHPCAFSEIAGDGCQGTSPLLESTAEQHETCACM